MAIVALRQFCVLLAVWSACIITSFVSDVPHGSGVW